MAILAEPDPGEKTDNNGLDAEARERSKLRARVNLTGYIEAAAEKRSVDGAELEFNQAMKIGAHRFPLEILAPAPTEIEHRATTDVDTVDSSRVDGLIGCSVSRRLHASASLSSRLHRVRKVSRSRKQEPPEHSVEGAQATVVAPLDHWSGRSYNRARSSVHGVFSAVRMI